MAAIIDLHPNDVEHLPPPLIPTHPAGEVTAFDEKTGLPIVRRHISSNHVEKQEVQNNSKGVPDEKGAVPTDDRHPHAESGVPGGEADSKGRDVLHQSTDRAELVRQAKDHARQFEDGLKASTRGIEGARFDDVRPEKNPTRIDEKINDEHQPIETIPDILAGRIGVDSPEAHEKTASSIKNHFNVVREEDQFKDGDPEFGYRVHKFQVQVTPQLSGEVHVVPKEVLEVNDKQHASYKAARDAEVEGNEKDAAKDAKRAKAINDAAMAKFDARNAETDHGNYGRVDHSDNAGSGSGAGADRVSRFKGRRQDSETGGAGTSGNAGSVRRDQESTAQSASSGDAQRPSSTATVRWANRTLEKLDKGKVPESSASVPRGDGSQNLVRRNNIMDGRGGQSDTPKLTKGQTVLVGDSHGIVRGGNPNFASGGRWSVETPNGTKTFKGSELKPVERVKPKADSPWTGYDLDSTLAHFEKWEGPTVIGKPTPLVEQAKKDIADGKDVRIFTARVADDPKGIGRAAIEAWSQRVFGKALPITHEKDRFMETLYDDRAHTVEPNTGKVLA